jgi:hypothetical protein
MVEQIIDNNTSGNIFVCSEAQKGSALEMEVHQAPSPRTAQGTEKPHVAPAQRSATQAG